jgi:hypothetical protein
MPTTEAATNSAPATTPQAERIAQAAACLFAGTRNLHGMRPKAARLLAAAARTPAMDSSGAEGAAEWGRAEQEILAAIHARLDARGEPAAGSAKKLKPGQQRQVEVLAALLQAAQAVMDDAQPALRIEAVRLEVRRVVVLVGGPGARAASRRAQSRARLWRPALGVGLKCVPAPPSSDDLALLRGLPFGPRTDVADAVGRALADGYLRLEASLAACRSGAWGEAAAASAAAQHLRQLLRAVKPLLKQRATGRLRARLERGFDRLAAVAAAHAALDAMRDHRAQAPEHVLNQLEWLAARLEAIARGAQAAALAWLDGRDAADLATGLMALIADPPLRLGADGPVAGCAPELLARSAGTLLKRQPQAVPGNSGGIRGAARAVVRLKAVLDAVDGGWLGPEAVELRAELAQLAQALGDVQRLEAVDGLVGDCLDDWAMQQAKRKAPQMHGAEAALAFRQKQRAQGGAAARALAEAWRPLRGRVLERRIQRLERAAQAAALG